MSKTFRKISIPAFAVLGVALVAGVVLADKAATFQLTINPGTLAVDVVDASYATIASPVVVFEATSASLDCSDTTGILGTAEQQIYITNPDAADTGYTVALAPTEGASATWSDGASNSIDFNDETDLGCATGKLSVAAGIVSNGKLAADSMTDIVAAGGSFSSVNSSVTLVNAAAASDDISEVVANGFVLTQTIPARTAAASYSLPMTISILGN